MFVLTLHANVLETLIHIYLIPILFIAFIIIITLMLVIAQYTQQPSTLYMIKFTQTQINIKLFKMRCLTVRVYTNQKYQTLPVFHNFANFVFLMYNSILIKKIR